MEETTQRKRGGRAFHSVLEPHLDFIREQRRRRKTWKEIAQLLLAEKGIRVTLYAPYRFCRRRLKRAPRPHWEEPVVGAMVPLPEAQPARPPLPASPPEKSKAPFPPPSDFRRPDPTQFNPDQFI